MKGLLLKDFYMTIKYCRSFCFIIMLFLVVSCFNSSNTFFALFPTLLSAMIPITLISYDERDKWNIYSSTLPISKAKIVSSKYIIGLFLQSSVFIFSIIMQTVHYIIDRNFNLSEYLSFALIIFFLSLMGPALVLPFIFKFGVEKGRIAYFIVIGILCSLTTFLAVNNDNFINQMSPDISIALIIIIALALYICSWVLSINFYKNTEV